MCFCEEFQKVQYCQEAIRSLLQYSKAYKSLNSIIKITWGISNWSNIPQLKDCLSKEELKECLDYMIFHSKSDKEKNRFQFNERNRILHHEFFRNFRNGNLPISNNQKPFSLHPQSPNQQHQNIEINGNEETFGQRWKWSQGNNSEPDIDFRAEHSPEQLPPSNLNFAVDKITRKPNKASTYASSL